MWREHGTVNTHYKEQLVFDECYEADDDLVKEALIFDVQLMFDEEEKLVFVTKMMEEAHSEFGQLNKALFFKNATSSSFLSPLEVKRLVSETNLKVQ